MGIGVCGRLSPVAVWTRSGVEVPGGTLKKNVTVDPERGKMVEMEMKEEEELDEVEEDEEGEDEEEDQDDDYGCDDDEKAFYDFAYAHGFLKMECGGGCKKKDLCNNCG